MDPCAISAAVENREVNGIGEEQFQVMAGNIMEEETVKETAGYEKYHMVVANILAEVLLPLTPVVVKHMKKGGIYITSGIIEEKEDAVVNAVKEAGLELLEVTRQGEWVSVTARKN